MTEDLRTDLIVIALEEAFGMQEPYARKVVAGTGALGRFRIADRDALEAAQHLVNRIEARCSRIEG